MRSSPRRVDANSESVSFSPGSALNQTRGEPAEETCVKSPSAAVYRNRCGPVHAPDTSTTAHHYSVYRLLAIRRIFAA